MTSRRQRHQSGQNPDQPNLQLNIPPPFGIVHDYNGLCHRGRSGSFNPNIFTTSGYF